MELAEPLRRLPPYMVRAAVDCAIEDADMVGTFLRDVCGFPPAPDRRLTVTAEWLLDVGAALRLYFWQQRGIEPRQLDPKLPDFTTALRDLVRQLRPDPGDSLTGLASGELSRRVFDAHIEHFSWVSGLELDAPVTLGPADEETVLEALADFLWAARPR
jgi:hypothetical protein